MYCIHKVHTYKENHSVCFPFGIGTLPCTPSLASECAPTPETKVGEAHSLEGEGLEESRFQRLEKRLRTLPTLWLNRSAWILLTLAGTFLSLFFSYTITSGYFQPPFWATDVRIESAVQDSSRIFAKKFLINVHCTSIAAGSKSGWSQTHRSKRQKNH